MYRFRPEIHSYFSVPVFDMASSAMELQLRYLLVTCGSKPKQNTAPHNICAEFHPCFLYAQTAVDAGGMPWWITVILMTEKPEYPICAPAMAPILESPVLICDVASLPLSCGSATILWVCHYLVGSKCILLRLLWWKVSEKVCGMIQLMRNRNLQF